VLENQQVFGQLDAFCRALYGSLEPREVAYHLANDCRRILGCDQVSVAWGKGKSARVEAISGAPGIDKQSPLVKAMHRLFAAVVAWGEKLVFQGTRLEALPPPVQEALDAYLAESNSRALIVLPLKDEREQYRPCSWGLMVESFGATGDVERFGNVLAV